MNEFSGEHTIVIQAPIEAVYEYVSDFPRHVEWNYQPTKMTKVTDGPVGVGSVFQTIERLPIDTPWIMKRLAPLVGMLMGSAGYTEAKITALDPDRRVAWEAKAPLKKGGFSAKAEWEIRLESQGEMTRVIQGYNAQMLGKSAKLIKPDTIAQLWNKELAANLAQLKTIMETHVAQGTPPDKMH